MKQTIAIDKLNLWKDNPKVEATKEDIDRLAKKIKRWKLWKPFLVWESKKVILGGNQRYKACKQLGKEDVWVEYREPKDNAEALEMALADNEMEVAYDKEKLTNQVELYGESIELEDYKVEIKSSSLSDFKTQEVEEDDFDYDEDKIKTDIKRGDIFKLGSHRLMCGDSTKVEDVEKLMDGKKADILYTDPPYGIKAVSSSGKLSRKYRKDISGDDSILYAVDAYNLSERLEIKHQLWWGANYYSRFLPHSGCWVVWDKDNGRSDQMDAELAWTNNDGVTRLYRQSSEKIGRVHPTQKPVSLFVWIVNRLDWQGDVLDLFGGSGSTVIACEELNRKCYMMEIDEKYCEVICQRWEKLTGKKRVKITDKTP